MGPYRTDAAPEASEASTAPSFGQRVLCWLGRHSEAVTFRGPGERHVGDSSLTMIMPCMFEIISCPRCGTELRRQAIDEPLPLGYHMPSAID